jgi:hypothetical protein
VQAAANGSRELAEVYEFFCSGGLLLVELSTHPGHTFKRQFIIMKVAHDRQPSVEPGSVWLVEIGRADVLGLAESVPIAYSQVVMVHQLQSGVQGAFWNVERPLIAWTDQGGGMHGEELLEGGDAEGQRMAFRRQGRDSGLGSFAEFTVSGHRCHSASPWRVPQVRILQRIPGSRG